MQPRILTLREALIENSARFLSTGLSIRGSDRCVECHTQEAQSFGKTAHAHALERIEIDEEPPDGEFFHTASGRLYRIHRQDQQYLQTEVSLDRGSGEEIVSTTYPVAWRIGSGNHSRSYLIERDGYLFESPITWYASQGFWAVSPGYDFREQEGFNRAAHKGCITCHAGRVAETGATTHRLQIIEASIGCENCHGPGSLHVTARAGDEPVSGEFDETIVNPNKLTRALNEDVCARCHLRSAGWSIVRGRKLDEFRPGLPLADYRLDFVPEQSSGSMSVVGHFEQMHASRCYTQSDSLTCTTCHNPHHSPDADDKLAYYRNICLQCHASEESPCGMPEAERLTQSSADDCVQCHMPKSGTDIPHFTFTHHRIAITQPEVQDDPQSQTRSADLVPFSDTSRLTPEDVERCLGLALQRSGKTLNPATQRAIFVEAKQHLTHVYNAGFRDAQVLGALAYLSWVEGNPDCLEFARQALEAPHCDPETRTDVLIVLGDMFLQVGNIAEAEQAFQKLTELRLRYTDWQMLGVCRSLQNDHTGAVEAFRKAMEFQPGSVDLHNLLADALEQQGDNVQAAQHRSTARRLHVSRRNAAAQAD